MPAISTFRPRAISPVSATRKAAGFIFLLCAGCAPHPAAPQQIISNPNFQITLQMTPAHPRQLDLTQFQVKVHDQSGNPVPDARVSADLAMPAMDMGKNEAVLHPAGQGVYAGTGRFTMAGAWRVSVSVERGTDAAQRYFAADVQ